MTTSSEHLIHPPLLLTITEAARVLAIGRTTFYGLIERGEIDTVTIGKARRVPIEALDEFVERRGADVA